MMERLLRRLGLVRAGRHADVVAHLKRAEKRADTIARQLEEVRADSARRKAKAHEADVTQKQARAALDEARREAARQAERLQNEARAALSEARREAARQAERVEKIKGDVERRSQHERARGGDAEALRTRLGDAERELTIAREHLMAIEVKLDILEGAANVLDGRIRSVLAWRAAADRGGRVRRAGG